MRKWIMVLVAGFVVIFTLLYFIDNARKVPSAAQLTVSPEAVPTINVLGIDFNGNGFIDEKTVLSGEDALIAVFRTVEGNTVNMEFIKSAKELTDLDIQKKGEISAGDPAFQRLNLFKYGVNKKDKSVIPLGQVGVQRLVIDPTVIVKMNVPESFKPGDKVGEVILRTGNHYGIYIITIDKRNFQ